LKTRALLEDIVVSFGLALLVIVLMLFASYNSTFIYRGF
jgi:hypothetical protein